jgi:hypothetical protein
MFRPCRRFQAAALRELLRRIEGRLSLSRLHVPLPWLIAYGLVLAKERLTGRSKVRADSVPILRIRQARHFGVRSLRASSRPLGRSWRPPATLGMPVSTRSNAAARARRADPMHGFRRLRAQSPGYGSSADTLP